MDSFAYLTLVKELDQILQGELGHFDWRGHSPRTTVFHCDLGLTVRREKIDGS